VYVQFYFIFLHGSDVEGELAFLFRHFTIGMNCAEIFVGLTESSELE